MFDVAKNQQIVDLIIQLKVCFFLFSLLFFSFYFFLFFFSFFV